MPQFDQMYYDEKWSVWDTWRSFGRNIRGYVLTASYRLGRVVTAQNHRANVITAQKRRSNIITGV